MSVYDPVGQLPNVTRAMPQSKVGLVHKIMTKVTLTCMFEQTDLNHIRGKVLGSF